MSETRNKLDAAAFCALPLVRQAYMALVVGLAVFIVTLVILREPFRGYLGEVQISGPAIAGLDLTDAASWLKAADSQTVVIATPAGPRSPRSQIRMTFQSPLPTPALARLDELAGRWLYQYLPQRLSAFRQAELRELRAAVNTARAQEDAASSEVETLRQRQLALLLSPAERESQITRPPEMPPLPVAAIPPLPVAPEPWRERLEALRLELARLLANFTEEHPRIIALRSQIERLEGRTPGEVPLHSQPAEGPELIPPPAGDRQAKRGSPVRPAVADRFITSMNRGATGGTSRESGPAELADAVAAAIGRHSQASRDRQAAEQRLSDRMQELSNQPAATEWSVEPAHVVTRLGGTPRCATLALGGLLAVVTGAVVFRGSVVAVRPARIESAGELASALELPVIGNLAAVRRVATNMGRRVFTAGRVRVLVHAGEAVIALAVAACLLSICMEPTLARQVLADPFGTLSEVVGRWQG